MRPPHQLHDTLSSPALPLPRAPRGVLFTFLTFLFIGVLIAGVAFFIQSSNQHSQSTVEVSVLNAINAKYDDLTDDIISLDQNIGIPTIVQRILPFSYSSDRNALTINQSLPIASGKLSVYFDIINAYRIFATDQNTQHTYDGVRVDLNTPKSSPWGGTATRANFNILPYCVQYQLLDTNRVALESNSTLGCSSNFDLLSSIQRIDINISLLATTDDYNVVSCDYNGDQCPHEVFASDANYPFFSLQFNDANCSNCQLTAAQKNISGYFYPADWNTIRYSCVGNACNSPPFQFQFGNGVRIEHGNTPAQMIMRVQFRQPISSFYYQDANYTVTKPGFDTLKNNVVVFPQ